MMHLCEIFTAHVGPYSAAGSSQSRVYIRGIGLIPKRLRRQRVFSSGSELLVLGGAMDCLPLLGRVAQDLRQAKVGTASLLYWGH